MKQTLALLAALLLVPMALLQAAEAPARTAAGKPNIILILADDLGYGSLACYGNTEVKTPNIDRLAASGMRFTDFHSNGALCTPTRAALMTGRYQQRCVQVADEELSPVFREQRKQNPAQRWAWGISTGELTLPAVLKQAGYRTALFGKWHLGYDHKFHPMNYGFDEFCGFVGGAVDNHTHIATHGSRELDWWKDRKIEDEKGYSTDLLTQYATDFIARNKDAPFFLYLAHGAVHSPIQLRQPSQKMSPVEAYQEVIGVLDESVGAVIEELRKQQIESKTLVIFCSDNGPAAPRGFAANANLRGKKGTAWEGGHRVPFIVRWPTKVKPNTICNQLVHQADIIATIAEILGTKLPENVGEDSFSLLTLLQGIETPIREYSVSASIQGMPAVRSGFWKYIPAPGSGGWGKGGDQSQPAQLYNLADDLGETKNLAAAMPEKVAEMKALLEKLITDGRSTPGVPQKNDVEVVRYPNDGKKPKATPAAKGGDKKKSPTKETAAPKPDAAEFGIDANRIITGVCF